MCISIANLDFKKILAAPNSASLVNFSSKDYDVRLLPTLLFSLVRFSCIVARHLRPRKRYITDLLLELCQTDKKTDLVALNSISCFQDILL